MELRYQDERFEKAEPNHIRAYQLERIRKLVAHAWRINPFYREHWLARGGKRGKVASFEEFRDKIPLIRKKDFVADQAANPPYGKRLAKVTEGGQPFYVFNTSGTSGQGVELHAMTERERRAAYAVSAYCYRWAGLEPGDSFFLCYGISLLGGGRIELYGLEDYGLTVFPVGTYDVHRKLELMQKFKPKAVMATTSYLGHLGAVGTETGNLHRPKALFGGGEGASFSWFQMQEEIWGARFFNHYGATQTRVDLIYPCERGIGTREHPGMLHNIDPGFFLEVLDPETGRQVKDGERGELVVTSLIHPDFPLIRYAMGDAAVYRTPAYCPCGRPFFGIELATIGRIDDMKKIKGVNVWPDAVDEALFVHGGIDEYQVVLTRDSRQSDVATVRVMPKPELDAGSVERLCEKARGSLRQKIGINFEVVSVPQGEIARSEYKARRWIDRR